MSSREQTWTFWGISIIAVILGIGLGWLGASALYSNRQIALNPTIQTGIGGGPGLSTSLNPVDVINGWPGRSQQAAQEMIAKYGQPNEIAPSEFIWYNNGPWKRTVVYQDEVIHNFPSPHADVLEQTVSYKVPAAMMDELGAFDGSLVVARTRGEVSVYADQEALNVLALNLADDITNRRKSVSQARGDFIALSQALTNGQKPQSTQKLQFIQSPLETGDPDSLGQ